VNQRPPRVLSLSDDPLWYKDAVFYEIRTRSFFDANGDGVGDLAGLAAKLDYLQDLGITAVWLLPLNPSPGRDDGYDVSDYTGVHPDVGTLADFRAFVEAAHARGIRVVTEMVLNHTSDAHPWFQRARQAPKGSAERDFYVWSDSPEKYADARIIFKDFETSNWSWDRVAGQYYWHRFFSHQPDLNFESPTVQTALLGVVDFWFEIGVDGLRLDAVPYLYEAEATNCENLPPTHAFLKKLRAHVDAKWKNRMLLAEANQWPEDAAAYFGDGDECHMNFHFPIMPRMFMAIHMEDRFPLLDILAQTPALPPTCQWAMFLRNHDELTLEMVTDEERDYMNRAYAQEPTMRINLGIRRRLAPLVGNDRRKMELLSALLFSLPGTPVLYYGDEIGMGDNVYLGDRNGVRTPMQWSADRNAGFSRVNPQRLILPIVIDPEYHYEAINVEAQQANVSSLLWWTKRLIALRKKHRAFGRGALEVLYPENPRVFTFVRELDGASILVVVNLSRFAQAVELDLAKHEGSVPTELFGRTRFPPITKDPYVVTLGGHAFYWFALEAPEDPQRLRASYVPPLIDGSSFEALAGGFERSFLEEVLPSFVRSRRWFRGRERLITQAHVAEAIPIGEGDGAMMLALVAIEYAEGEPETYAVPMAFVAKGARAVAADSVIASARVGGQEGVIVDALEDGASSRALVDTIARRARIAGLAGELVATPYDGAPEGDDHGELKTISSMHANASIRWGDRFLLKVFRLVEDGRSPELELGRFLTTHAPGVAPDIVGAIEYVRGSGEPRSIAALLRFVPNEGTAWEHARAEIQRFYDRVVARSRDAAPPEGPNASIVARSKETPSAAVLDVIGSYSTTAELLGTRTAELHLALASSDDPAFAPAPFSSFDRRSLYQSLRNLVGRVMRTLRTRRSELSPHAATFARALFEHEPAIVTRFEALVREPIEALRTRIHGDYHLAQVLHTGRDFVIIDFDGGHDHDLPERRRKRSPLRDVAGMVRSLHYAAYSAIYDGAVVREADRAIVLPWAAQWSAWSAAAFLRGYRERAVGAPFLPASDESLAMLLDRFVLAKAFHELGGELAEPTERIAVPLGAIVHMLGLTPVE
jgi:maltose alpha-D-glucosyltransferase/alpha-amylase